MSMWKGIVVGVLGLGAFIALMVFVVDEERQRKQRIADFGYESRMNGVESFSNPYQYETEKVIWLRGWMRANEELKKKE